MSEKWRKVPSNFDVLSELDQQGRKNNPPCCVLIQRVTEIVYYQRPSSASETLTKPLCRKELSRITKWIIRVVHASLLNGGALSKTREVGTSRGLLTPGRQCRICLMHFREGDEVRKLFGCNHIFHTRCVDQWLLHVSPYCPLDGMFAAPAILVPPTGREEDRFGRCFLLQGISNTMKNAGDILKTSSFSDVVRNPRVNGKVRQSHQDNQMCLGQAEIISTNPTFEVKSAALCRRSSSNISMRINSSIALRPLGRTQEASHSIHRMSEKYQPRI
ncbi:E3 ubiquitin-protein ligase Zswim2 [Taenia crassiceps]|uniref:E3 ubiquitin-protein ligase Zswim2 n=1 Tax=Taenia crassiceps TaxID=6207 RepID=A0ABR4QN23_9CEST